MKKELKMVLKEGIKLVTVETVTNGISTSLTIAHESLDWDEDRFVQIVGKDVSEVIKVQGASIEEFLNRMESVQTLKYRFSKNNHQIVEVLAVK